MVWWKEGTITFIRRSSIPEANAFSSASGRRLISQTMPEQLGSADKENIRNGPARLPKVSRCPDHRQFSRRPAVIKRILVQPLGCSRTLPSARFTPARFHLRSRLLRRTCQLTHSQLFREYGRSLPLPHYSSTLRGFSAAPCCAPCSNLATPAI